MAYTPATGTQHANLPDKINRNVTYTDNLECGIN